MSYREVTMFRIVCDAKGCDASPGDTSDYSAWSDADGAQEELNDSFWNWTTITGQTPRHYCPEHAPNCEPAQETTGFGVVA